MKTDSVNITINGNNNKVIFPGGKGLSPKVIVVALISIAIAIIVLAVSLCCPELLADFIRWIISSTVS